MARNAPPRVLVADDDDDILSMVQNALLPEHYDIVLARDGQEAVKVARDKTPDLILMDVEMPHMDGLEATRVLRTDDQTRHVPIIMLTSRVSERDILQGFEGGAHDYITKPFSIAHLRARVKTWLLRAEEEGTGDGDARVKPS
jgi:DNA-binding response OmpR family regulator